MRIIDYEYIIPSLILIIGLPLLLYLKISQQSIKPLNITIYGSTIQTAMLAYYVDKNIEKVFGQNVQKYLNISLVSPFDSTDQNRKQTQKIKRQTDKILLTFCGVENHLLSMLHDLDLQFQINQYGIYFSQLKEGKQVQKNMQTYRIKGEYPIRSFLQYGLSHITAKNIFQKFQEHLQNYDKNYNSVLMKKQQIQDLSMSSAINKLFPYQFDQSGIKYLSEVIGLDQQYIHDYIMPVIWGSYLHESNSISSMFKLLPLFCTKNKQIGNSLALLIDQNQLHRKLIEKIKHINVNHIYNHHLQQFKVVESDEINQQNGRSSHLTDIEVTYLNTFVNNSKQQDQKEDERQEELSYEKFTTNILFIIEDYEMVNKKEISYYKTIVDGQLKGDEEYPEFFSLYFTYSSKTLQQAQQQNEPRTSQKNQKYLYSATRICKQNCKNFNKNIYMLISKQKLSQKDLGMFQQHHIVYYKKYWLPKTQLPSGKKFQETTGVYRVYDTESVSQAYQFKLTVFDQLSKVVVAKMVDRQ